MMIFIEKFLKISERTLVDSLTIFRRFKEVFHVRSHEIWVWERVKSQRTLVELIFTSLYVIHLFHFCGRENHFENLD